MEKKNADTGSDLVIDNRKLVIGFFLLMTICAAFFVIGFMEGKRQGMQAKLESLPATQGTSIAESIEAQEASPPSSNNESKSAEDQSASEPLDWYKKVNESSEPKSKMEDLVESVPSSPPADPPKSPAPKKSESQERGSDTVRPATQGAYNVQVGAFSRQAQAERLVDELRAKGYSPTIEEQQTRNLYLVKAGYFASRAEAVAIQIRLKNDGFDSIIKSK